MFNARLLQELLAALYRIRSSDLKKLLFGSIYESWFYLSVMNHQISLIILCPKVLLEFFVNSLYFLYGLAQIAIRTGN